MSISARAAAIANGAPVLGEFDRSAGQLPGVPLELGLQALEQRERVGGAARESRDDLAAGELAHLARAGLQDRVLQADLAIAADHDLTVLAHRQDRRAVTGARPSRAHGASRVPRRLV